MLELELGLGFVRFLGFQFNQSDPIRMCNAVLVYTSGLRLGTYSLYWILHELLLLSVVTVVLASIMYVWHFIEGTKLDNAESDNASASHTNQQHILGIQQVSEAWRIAVFLHL